MQPEGAGYAAFSSIIAAIGGDNIPGPETPGIDLSLETMAETKLLPLVSVFAL